MVSPSHHLNMQQNQGKRVKVIRGVILLMAEILHQLIGSFSHYLQGFIHLRWCRISAINSTMTCFSGSDIMPFQQNEAGISHVQRSKRVPRASCKIPVQLTESGRLTSSDEMFKHCKAHFFMLNQGNQTVSQLINLSMRIFSQ